MDQKTAEIVRDVARERQGREIQDEKGSLHYLYVDLRQEVLGHQTDASKVVELHFDNSLLQERLQMAALTHIASCGFVILVSILFAFYISSRISNPIHSIIESVNRIARGDLNHEITVNTENELKLLKESINLMVRNTRRDMKHIRESEEKIIQYNEQLEDMVHLRTSELHQSNLSLSHKNSELIRDLRMASRIQHSMIPDNLSHNKQLLCGARYAPVSSVGGDFYDIIKIDEDLYGLLIADVSGHGVPAAIITAMARVFFVTNSRVSDVPSEICERVNHEMYQLIGDLEYFLTAYYGILNLKTGLFVYTNAGHLPALLYRQKENTVEELYASGTFIGSFPHSEYENHSTTVEPGDRIFLFTDGIIEASNEREEFYSYERVRNFLLQNAQQPPQEIVNALFHDVDVFCESSPSDDRAMLCVELLPGEKPPSGI